MSESEVACIGSFQKEMNEQCNASTTGRRPSLILYSLRSDMPAFDLSINGQWYLEGTQKILCLHQDLSCSYQAQPSSTFPVAPIRD